MPKQPENSDKLIEIFILPQLNKVMEANMPESEERKKLNYWFYDEDLAKFSSFKEIWKNCIYYTSYYPEDFMKNYIEKENRETLEKIGVDVDLTNYFFEANPRTRPEIGFGSMYHMIQLKLTPELSKKLGVKEESYYKIY